MRFSGRNWLGKSPSFPPQKPLRTATMKKFRLAQIIRIIGPAFRAL
jgi:hypothetical protein